MMDTSMYCVQMTSVRGPLPYLHVVTSRARTQLFSSGPDANPGAAECSAITDQGQGHHFPAFTIPLAPGPGPGVFKSS